MTNPDDPAFSQQFVDQDGKPSMCGLTKREWYAGLAMQGMMSLGPRELLENCSSKFKTVGEWVASNCIDMADALINELNKPKP